MGKQEELPRHLADEEYTLASVQWYDTELRLKQSVEGGDTEVARQALLELSEAVEGCFAPIFHHGELMPALQSIVGGILHFACRDAGLPPSYLTLLIVWQRNTLTAVRTMDEVLPAIERCVEYACRLVRDASQPSFGPLVRRCVREIQTDLTCPITATQLANRLGVTRQHLCTCFKRETGTTITDYVMRERVLLAKYYLKQGALSVTQVALLCGYGDLNYFGRVFKRQTGLSPRAYMAGE